ncbi:hypothetical protein DFH11DRAFT_914573 [Phellopilus nigrolimitatus]|nr:hypothetical protein DFH11DRAFT_914573 [Phellopilus nigrolimitatus]
MGSAQSAPVSTAATSYTRGARAENRISVSDHFSDDGEVQLHALARLEAALDSPDNPASQLQRAVHEIGLRAGDITARFAAISAALDGVPDPRRSAGDVFYRFVVSLFRRCDPGKVESLRRQWSEIVQLHKKALWKSRNVAATNAAKIKGLLEDFIPYLQSDEELSEKKAEISAYLEVNKQRKVEEQELQDEFREIGEKLQKFEKDLREACACLSSASEKVEELEREIRNLRVFGFIARLLPQLFCDEDLLKVTNWKTSANVAYAARQIQDKEAKKCTREKERLAIYAEQPELEIASDLSETLTLIEPDLCEAVIDTATFSSIWGMISTDLIELSTRLEVAGSTARSQELFSCRLAAIKACYKMLQCALYAYAAALDIDKAAVHAGHRTTLMSASHQLEK